MTPRLLLFLTFTLSAFSLKAQLGGKYSYEFVNVANNAHVAGIGGMNVSLYDQDVNLFLQNPALLHDSVNHQLSVNYLPYPAGIKSSSLTYAFGKKATWGAGLQYFSYGRMDQTEPDGSVSGTFSANDMAFTLARSHTMRYYTMGVSAKFIASNIANYWALATMFDIGGRFTHPKRDMTVGLVFKNVGTTWKRYSPESEIHEPFDIQLGFTYKLEHFPLRFSLTAHHLYKWDVVYNDITRPKQFNFDGTPVIEKTTVLDKITRHLVVGGEFIFSKGFHIYAGYNFLRRGELRLDSKSGGAGFTIGGMLRIKTLHFGYSHAFYSVAGGSNNITLTLNTDSFIKRK